MSEIADIEDYTNSKLLNENTIKLFVKELIKDIGSPTQSITVRNIELAITKLRQKYKLQPSKSQMRYIYDKYFSDQHLNNTLGRYLIKKACRSRSGVLVSTVVLRPDVFSCPKKCSYCPTETDLNGRPTQPKSYLSSEPAGNNFIRRNMGILSL